MGSCEGCRLGDVEAVNCASTLRKQRNLNWIGRFGICNGYYEMEDMEVFSTQNLIHS